MKFTCDARCCGFVSSLLFSFFFCECNESLLVPIMGKGVFLFVCFFFGSKCEVVLFL
jgi:hypothetical protein